jgi:N-acyl-D-amino-acid deacylase
MIAIGITGGARMQISHLKAIGRANWGKAKAALNVLEAARRRGLDISADQYPYEATSTSLTALVPQWAMSGGVEALLARLAQPDTRKAIKREISREMLLRGGPENIVIAGAAPGYALDETGKTLADVAAVRRCRPDEAVIRLLLKTRATVAAVYFSLSSGDVASIAASPDVAVGSDGQGLSLATDGGTMTHPRSYGTFPRVLAKFVREDGLLSWDTAVNKMSGLPASRLGFTDRGILRQGMAADIVVFDQQTVADGGDFTNPHRYPAGIEYVFIAGEAVARGGRLTGARPGRVLRRGF